MTRDARRLFCTAAVGLCLLATSGGAQPPTQDPQRPVFRAGAHFVRVDAYPAKDGRIIPDLTKDDFEVLEDGARQEIETFEFVDYSGITPEALRRDPNSPQDAFALAADPRYRIFVLYLDAWHVPLAGSHAVRRPLVDMLNRMIGPRDLFGVLTPAQRPRLDLMLGQQTLTIEEQLTRHWDWGRHGTLERTPAELALEACFVADPALVADLIRRTRLNKVFSDLEETIALLGGLREERKNILLVSRGWDLPRPNDSRAERGAPGRSATIGSGTFTRGAGAAGGASSAWCRQERLRLLPIDFAQRHRDLIARAREANVTMYPLNPMGLEAGVGLPQQRDITYRDSRLRELADNTGGIAVRMTNNLQEGVRRIADDLSGMYVLGYYTSNTNWNGRLRRITVRLKPSGTAVRARREYRAPTDAEMAALRNAPAAASGRTSAVEAAFAALTSVRVGAALHVRARVVGEHIEITVEIDPSLAELGRWNRGGDIQVMSTGSGGEVAGTGSATFAPGARGAVVRLPIEGRGPWHAAVRVRGDGEPPEEERFTIPPAAHALLGDPIIFRAAPTAPRHPAAVMHFRRTERLAAEWPLLGAVERHEVRLLGRDGQPLTLVVPSTVRDSRLDADLNLAPLTAGDYAIEVRVVAGSREESAVLAFRVRR